MRRAILTVCQRPRLAFELSSRMSLQSKLSTFWLRVRLSVKSKRCTYYRSWIEVA